MNILYNITPLLGAETGIGHYTRKIVKGLEQHNEVRNIGLFSTHKIHSEIPELPVIPSATNQVNRNSFNVKKIILENTPNILKLGYSRIIEQRVGKQLNKYYKSFIYHETNYNFLPFAGRKISTFHDLSILHFPEYHPIERVKYFEKRLKYTLESANHFITDSKFVKQEMIDLLGVAEEKITSIPLGVDKIYKQRTSKEIALTLSKYKLLGTKYLLIVGSFEPRKNIKLVLAAYDQLPSIIKQEYVIVHVGPEGWNYEKVWQEALSLRDKNQFISLGYIPKIDLAHIYNGASIFIFPSYYEGFGFPPLEAMASGIPVISTQNSSLGEIVDNNNAYIVDVDDIDLLCNRILHILSEGKSEIVSKISHGFLTSKRFEWETTLETTLEVYKKL